MFDTFRDYDEYRASIPEEVWNHIRDIIRDGDYECADSLRAAWVGDAATEAWYADIRDGGCCGFVDREVLVEGVPFLVGFNHGH
jgi:hypothetical protein